MPAKERTRDVKTHFQLHRDMMGAWANWAYCTQYNRKHPGHYAKAKLADYVLAYRRARAALKAGEFVPEVNSRGNTVWRNEFATSRLGLRGNYFSDFYDYSRQLPGWEHLPTWQDASYFGVIYNRESRFVFTYAEGDKTLVECPTEESFQAEIDDAKAFYDRGKRT